MSDEELTSRMFRAAQAALKETGGLAVTLDALEIEALTRKADVSRSAVYRLWPMKEEFQQALLLELAAGDDPESQPFDRATQDLAAEVILSDLERLQSPEGRRLALEEAVRVAVSHNVKAVTANAGWRNWCTLVLTSQAVHDDELRQALVERLRERDVEWRADMADFYRTVMPQLGLRPRPPFTDETAATSLSMLGSSLVEGLSVHHAVQPSVMDPLSETGSERPWTAAALGFLALVDLVAEPDPGFKPPSAP